MSGILININVGETLEKSSIIATGQQIEIIADSDRASFGIGSDADLRRAVEKCHGKRPNDAYLHSPTPCVNYWSKKALFLSFINKIAELIFSCVRSNGNIKRANDDRNSFKQHDDLYKTNEWSQVQRVLEPKNAKILSVTTRPTIVASKTLRNNCNEPGNFSTKIAGTVTNTVSNLRSNSSTVSSGQSLKYKVDFIVAGAEGTTNFGFTQNCNKNETVTNLTTLATEIAVSVTLKPEQSKIAQLSACMGTMRVQITYEAYLIGQVAVSYNPPFKDHHFHALDIGEVLGDSRKQITDDIEVVLYTNETCELKDAN